MPYPTCDFLKADGVLCGFPALHSAKYCYFHTRQLTSYHYGARARHRRSTCRLDLRALDDRRAIQDMFNQLFAALCSDSIEHRRASAMRTALRRTEKQLSCPPER